MTTYIDENGLTIPTQAEIQAQCWENMKAKFGAKLREDVDGNMYRIAMMVGQVKSELLAAIQAAVSGLNPDTTSGEMASELVKFNGITRNESQYSTVTLELTANSAGCTVPIYSIVATEGGDQFETTAEVVIGADATETAPAIAVEAGDVTADPGAINTIVTPVYGWASVTNPLAATPGSATETDPALRRRRWDAAAGVGTHHESVIKSALEDLDGVTAVAVEVSQGLIRCIVKGGDSDEIAETIFGVGTGLGSAAAGIDTDGDQEVEVEDTETGQTKTIRYDVSADVPIYIHVYTRKGSRYPDSGDEDMRDAIIEFFAGDLEIVVDDETISVDPFGLGDDVVASRLYTPCNAVPGHSVQYIYIGKTDPPTSSADIAILAHQIAVTGTAYIEIHGA